MDEMDIAKGIFLATKGLRLLFKSIPESSGLSKTYGFGVINLYVDELLYQDMIKGNMPEERYWVGLTIQCGALSELGLSRFSRQLVGRRNLN